MGKLNVKNGTPVGNEHLCRSCNWGQYTTGYKESEVMVFCTNTSPNFRVLYQIRDCSEYYDKHKPDYDEMKKLAIDLNPRRMSTKTKGFNVTEVLRPLAVPVEEEEEEEDETEAALAP